MKKILYLIGFIFLLSGCGTTQSTIEKSNVEKTTSNNVQQTTQQEEKAKFTLTMFNQIKTGMTYDLVKKICKEDGKKSASSSDNDVETYALYMWSNEDGSNMSITFREGKVKSKTQAGLE